MSAPAALMRGGGRFDGGERAAIFEAVVRTRDLGGNASTQAFADAARRRLG
jgi:hypothetical protein